jgi:hypothetical protein
MATCTRADARNNGGTFANTDLLWYAQEPLTLCPHSRSLDKYPIKA